MRNVWGDGVDECEEDRERALKDVCWEEWLHKGVGELLEVCVEYIRVGT